MHHRLLIEFKSEQSLTLDQNMMGLIFKVMEFSSVFVPHKYFNFNYSPLLCPFIDSLILSQKMPFVIE